MEMKTVKQVCQLTGISPRTLRHYHSIGLLTPSSVTEGGYRLYDEGKLEKLRQILALREAGLSLKDIQEILDDPGTGDGILEAHAQKLREQIRQLQDQVHFTHGIRQTGGKNMDWKKSAKNQEEYEAQAKVLYGKTDAYREYQEKSQHRTKAESDALGQGVMDFFVRLGAMRHLSPDSPEAQAWAAQLQAYLCDNYYNCTREIFRGLGQLYACGGSMTENIDAAGGKGTGEFANQVIEIFCK